MESTILSTSRDTETVTGCVLAYAPYALYGSAVGGLVSEEGLASGEGIMRLIQGVKVHPALLDVVV